MAEPLTLRYNNPGAIEYKPFLAQYGATLGPNGRYAQFPDRASGYKAMEGLLGTYQTKHKLNTVEGIVNRWAPPNVDNNSTSTYTQKVAQQLGVDPRAPLDPSMTPRLAEAMASYEAGRPVPRDGAAPSQPSPMSRPTPQGATPVVNGVYDGLTPDDVTGRRAMAQKLMGEATSTAPVGHWTGALARALTGLNSSMFREEASAVEKKGQASTQGFMQAAMQDPRAAVASGMANPWTAPMAQKIGSAVVANSLKPAETTPLQKDYAVARQQGFTGSLMDFDKQRREAGRPVTNIDMKAESSFQSEAGKVTAKRLNENVEQGTLARSSQGDLDRLDELSSAIGTQGAVADVKKALGPYATALGVQIEGLNEIQAFSSVVSRLAPTMRPPGSGATSDFEFKQFLNALPQLSQTTEGRKLVLDQMRAMNAYKAAVGDISAKALSGELERKDADGEIRKLGNPLGLWRQGAQALSPSAPQQPPAQGAGRFAAPQMSPAGALVESLRSQLQSGQIQLPQIIDQARKALEQGAPAEAIRKRLQDAGVDPAQVGI